MDLFSAEAEYLVDVRKRGLFLGEASGCGHIRASAVRSIRLRTGMGKNTHCNFIFIMNTFS